MTKVYLIASELFCFAVSIIYPIVSRDNIKLMVRAEVDRQVRDPISIKSVKLFWYSLIPFGM